MSTTLALPLVAILQIHFVDANNSSHIIAGYEAWKEWPQLVDIAHRVNVHPALVEALEDAYIRALAGMNARHSLEKEDYEQCLALIEKSTGDALALARKEGGE